MYVVNLIGIYPEWNVKMMFLISFSSSLYWNISRMECKGVYAFHVSPLSAYWNISRMECKDPYSLDSHQLHRLEYIQNGM